MNVNNEQENDPTAVIHARSESDALQTPSETTGADNSWLAQIDWDYRLRDRFTYYSNKYEASKAKRLFLDEIRIESAEMEQLYKDEVPGDEELPWL